MQSEKRALRFVKERDMAKIPVKVARICHPQTGLASSNFILITFTAHDLDPVGTSEDVHVCHIDETLEERPWGDRHRIWAHRRIDRSCRDRLVSNWWEPT
jgi:hypothetical protein